MGPVAERIEAVAGDAVLRQPTRRASVKPAHAAASSGHLERLQKAISEAVALSGDAIDVGVTDVCGALEVRVWGPSGRLRLFFDASEADLAFVRSAVCRTLDRYSTPFLAPAAVTPEVLLTPLAKRGAQ